MKTGKKIETISSKSTSQGKSLPRYEKVIELSDISEGKEDNQHFIELKTKLILFYLSSVNKKIKSNIASNDSIETILVNMLKKVNKLISNIFSNISRADRINMAFIADIDQDLRLRVDNNIKDITIICKNIKNNSEEFTFTINKDRDKDIGINDSLCLTLEDLSDTFDSIKPSGESWCKSAFMASYNTFRQPGGCKRAFGIFLFSYIGVLLRNIQFGNDYSITYSNQYYHDVMIKYFKTDDEITGLESGIHTFKLSASPSLKDAEIIKAYTNTEEGIYDPRKKELYGSLPFAYLLNGRMILTHPASEGIKYIRNSGRNGIKQLKVEGLDIKKACWQYLQHGPILVEGSVFGDLTITIEITTLKGEKVEFKGYNDKGNYCPNIMILNTSGEFNGFNNSYLIVMTKSYEQGFESKHMLYMVNLEKAIERLEQFSIDTSFLTKSPLFLSDYEIKLLLSYKIDALKMRIGEEGVQLKNVKFDGIGTGLLL